MQKYCKTPVVLFYFNGFAYFVFERLGKLLSGLLCCKMVQKTVANVFGAAVQNVHQVPAEAYDIRGNGRGIVLLSVHICRLGPTQEQAAQPGCYFLGREGSRVSVCEEQSS